MHRIFTLLLLSFIGPILSAQVHWETLVKADHNWNYLIGDSQAPASWYSNGFDDSSWSSAKGSFGFGDDDDTTILSINYSLYIRHEFTIDDRSVIDSLLLDIDYDDAYVVYLNGSMVSRSFNVETDFPPYNYTPIIDQEASMYMGGQASRVSIPESHLLDGENVIAIQGINVNPTSSDFSLAPFLQAKVDADGIVYEEVPGWFRDPDAPFESKLPIIAITTENGQAIPDEPKLTAHMGIVNNESGLNELPGTFNDYDGKIGIERRGASSQGYAKVGYGLETRLENGENNNVSLLGLPVENDWVLHGPYSDKSLIRNVLAYHFAAAMGQYAPRTRLCELFVNDAYSGVYVLTEKIKRDTFRLDIGRLNPDEVSGRDLTGGYIFKLDKGEEWDPLNHWVSPYQAIDGNDIRILYHYPEPEEMPKEQQDYIRNFVTDFEDALAGDQFYDPILGYKPYIDEQSFIDFYLVNELAKNVDGFRISTFLHKDKDKLDRVSPIKAGPVWDFNFGFGNADYYDASLASGWQSEYQHPDNYWSNPFWWRRLKEDSDYFNLMVDSWKEYRTTILSDARVEEVIDSLTTMLADAQQRNFDAFPVLNQYVWANNYVGGSYENEIAYLKGWISDRIAWIDIKLNSHKYPNSIEVNDALDGMDLQIFPNPVLHEFTMALRTNRGIQLQIEVLNLLGQITYRADFDLAQGPLTLYFGSDMVNQAMPQSGIYLLNILMDGSLVGTRKIVKQ
jgi:hypothetical protein